MREKGVGKKHDQNWLCFSGRKAHLSPVKAKFCLKGRQKTRLWPLYIYLSRLKLVETPDYFQGCCPTPLRKPLR